MVNFLKFLPDSNLKQTNATNSLVRLKIYKITRHSRLLSTLRLQLYKIMIKSLVKVASDILIFPAEVTRLKAVCGKF